MIISGKYVTVKETSTGAWEVKTFKMVKHHGEGVSDECVDIFVSPDLENVANHILKMSAPEKFIAMLNAHRVTKRQKLVR